MTGTDTLRDWADRLGRDWEARARLPSRDLFVASHPGWNDPDAWERHARTELELFLSGLDPAWLAAADVLEIGCGSGRLVPFLRPRVRTYTGFDIAAGMVAAARRRAAALPDVRLYLGDGLSVPEAARDRPYRLIVAVAVFIHCPREVIAANLESAWRCLQPGGQLRFQVLADPDDREGIAAAATAAGAADSVAADASAVIAGLSDEERRLVFDTYYMGHRFRYAEVQPFVAQAAPGRVALYRGDPAAIYGLIEKPA